MKKIIGIIVCMMLGLSGIFFFLAAREEMKRIVLKKEREMIAKKMQENYDEVVKLFNSSKKPKMVKF